MKVENAVYPTAEGLKSLTDLPSSGPIVMVNLLKFRDKAIYKDGRHDDVSGRQAYMRYAEPMQKIVEGAGGRFMFASDVKCLVIGQADELWDVVGIVEYPSRDAFQRIATSDAVREIGVHREAGLAGQLLILTVQR